ncbi:MAG: transposase [Spirochaetota bacterium]
MSKVISDEKPNAVIYIDESGFETSVCRDMCRAKYGEKVCGKFPGKRGKRLNLLAGKQGSKIVSPILIEGKIDTEVFTHWLKNYLFESIPDRCLIIMDNASFHRTSKVKEVFDKSSHILKYLPPYSPDLNPIEKIFGVLKKQLKYAPEGTTIDSIINKFCFT